MPGLLKGFPLHIVECQAMKMSTSSQHAVKGWHCLILWSTLRGIAGGIEILHLKAEAQQPHSNKERVLGTGLCIRLTRARATHKAKHLLGVRPYPCDGQ